MDGIAGRLAIVRQRMEEAAERAGRRADEIRLVAVSKTRSAAEVREAQGAGCTAFGENYVQELLSKREEIGDAVEWHFIGHLQTNKARCLAPFCALIHGVDSLRLAGEIDRRAAAADRRQAVLVEVRLSEEESKHGVDEAGVVHLAQGILELPGLELRGLMTMPPYAEEPESSRSYFVRLRRLRDRLLEAGMPSGSCGQLSMGMTSDYEVAIEEGATIVRIGTAIFGPRNQAGA